MSAEPSQFFPHNTLWRQLRRRYFVDGLSLLGLVFTCPPVLCSVVWLMHGPLWLIVCFGALWLLTCVFMTFIMAMSLAFRKRRDVRQSSPRPIRLGLLWLALVNGATLIALLIGRVDWAFYMTFGLSGWSVLWSGRALSFQTVLHLMLSLALCLAFATHAVWMVVFLLLPQVLPFWRSTVELRQAIRLLPTRAEYVARSREACAAGGG